jgi:UDP-N-acetyl-D-galactosamine dehydrogenase
MDSETLETVARVYGTVVRAGIHRVPSIKTAELSKLLENTQRDVNIALMNEIVRMCDGWDIDTRAVLEAAATKWNFHPYSPGLVGGHCIGIDSWYLAFGAEQMGYHSELIPAVRSINDGMGRFVAEKTVKAILEAGKELRGARVAVLGFTFKENCPDIRNTGVIRLVEELRSYGVEVLVTDPVADPDGIRRAYGLETCDLRSIHAVDAAVLAVAHDAYRDLTVADLSSLYREGCCVLMDVKGILNPSDFVSADYLYRRL